MIPRELLWQNTFEMQDPVQSGGDGTEDLSGVNVEGINNWVIYSAGGVAKKGLGRFSELETENLSPPCFPSSSFLPLQSLLSRCRELLLRLPLMKDESIIVAQNRVVLNSGR